MSKKFILSEEEKLSIRKMYLSEESEMEGKKFCHSGNVKTLEEIMGDDESGDYIEGVSLRKNGVRGLADRLELMKTLRLHPNISDGGEHLSYELLNHLRNYRNKHYFDETNNDCHKAMDKVIELYKENEHGEELVKDIEKVLKHSDPTPRAKEYLKRCLMLIKEK